MIQGYVDLSILIRVVSLDIVFLHSSEKWIRRCKDGVMVRALASQQCGPGSIPGLGVICGLTLLLVLVLVLFFLVFLRVLKNQDFQIPINQILQSEGHRFVSRDRLLSVSHALTLNKVDLFTYLFYTVWG